MLVEIFIKKQSRNPKLVKMKNISSDQKPIAALATGSVNGAIAIIRLSGQDTHKLLNKALIFSSTIPLKMMQMKRASFVNPESNLELDDILAVFFQALAI